MVSGPYIKMYSNLILKLLDMYSDDTVMKAVDFINTDKLCDEVTNKLDSKNLSEAKFLKELEKLGA